MTDNAKQLRELALELDEDCTGEGIGEQNVALMLAAADEIECLREAIHKIQMVCSPNGGRSDRGTVYKVREIAGAAMEGK